MNVRYLLMALGNIIALGGILNRHRTLSESPRAMLSEPAIREIWQHCDKHTILALFIHAKVL